MAFREVRVYEVKEVLRLWLRGKGTRPISALVGVDRKTVQRYIVHRRRPAWRGAPTKTPWTTS